MTVVNGKPIAPKLLTLDVNLKGVFYSEWRICRHRSCDPNDRPQPYTLGCTTSSVTALPTRGRRSFSSAQLVRSSLLPGRIRPNYACSILDWRIESTAVRCLEARRARPDACDRPHRNCGQHPHRRHPPMVRRYVPPLRPSALHTDRTCVSPAEKTRLSSGSG